MSARRAMIALGLGLAAAGCGRHRAAPIAPPADLPPQVEAVHPAARSFGVPYDETEVWAQFAQPLDSTSVTALNVFFKVNTLRLQDTVWWEAATRRVHLRPDTRFQLAETYTVELAPGLKAADGVRLGKTYAWQFTISSIRRLEHPIPPSPSVHESPFAPLSWDRTESSAGTVVYDVFAGTDSASIAARRPLPLARVSLPYLIRFAERWGSDTTYYWAVTAINQTIGERLDGPVWSFRTAPEGTPVDSVSLPATRWGFYTRSTRQSTCFASVMSSGAAFVCVASWDPGQIQPRRSIVGARILLTNPFSQNPSGCAISSVRGPVVIQPCDFVAAGLPFADQFLASSRLAEPFVLRLASDALTAHVTAVHYGVPTYGYLIEANSNVTYAAPPVLVLTFYR